MNSAAACTLIIVAHPLELHISTIVQMFTSERLASPQQRHKIGALQVMASGGFLQVGRG